MLFERGRRQTSTVEGAGEGEVRFFFFLSPLGSPKWLLLLLPHEKDDIGRGKGRTQHGSGGKGDSGRLMDSSTAPALENRVT